MRLIEGDFDNAESLFQRAEEVSEEKELVFLQEYVKTRKSEFDGELQKMQELLKRNVNLQERLKQANIEDYFKKALNIVGR